MSRLEPEPRLRKPMKRCISRNAWESPPLPSGLPGPLALRAQLCLRRKDQSSSYQYHPLLPFPSPKPRHCSRSPSHHQLLQLPCLIPTPFDSAELALHWQFELKPSLSCDPTLHSKGVFGNCPLVPDTKAPDPMASGSPPNSKPGCRFHPHPIPQA